MNALAYPHLRSRCRKRVLRSWRRLAGDCVEYSGVRSAEGGEFQGGIKQQRQNAWIEEDVHVTLDVTSRRSPRPLQEHCRVRTPG